MDAGLVLAICLLVGAICTFAGILIGGCMAESFYRKQAISHGVATWKRDRDGDPVFTYITPRERDS